jgi:hypothetical protein
VTIAPNALSYYYVKFNSILRSSYPIESNVHDAFESDVHVKIIYDIKVPTLFATGKLLSSERGTETKTQSEHRGRARGKHLRRQVHLNREPTPEPTPEAVVSDSDSAVDSAAAPVSSKRRSILRRQEREV